MSPLLEISLLIVALFWIVPVVLAISNSGRFLFVCRRAIPSLPLYVRNEIARTRFYLEQLTDRKEQRQQEIEFAEIDMAYQDLQDYLIQVRQETARSITVADSLENRLRNLNIAQTEKGLSSKEAEKLSQLTGDLHNQKEITEVLRARLTDLETEIQKAYTKKQIFKSKANADFAAQKAQRLLSRDHGAAFAAALRLEQSLVKREDEIFGSSILEDRYVSFPQVAKRISALSIDYLEVNELQALMKAIELAAEEARHVIQSVVPFEQVLASELDRANEFAFYWSEKVSESGSEPFDLHRAEIAKSHNLYAAAITRRILEASMVCTHEFKDMHTQLTIKEGEILDKILTLNSCRGGGIDEQSVS